MINTKINDEGNDIDIKNVIFLQRKEINESLCKFFLK